MIEIAICLMRIFLNVSFALLVLVMVYLVLVEVLKGLWGFRR